MNILIDHDTICLISGALVVAGSILRGAADLGTTFYGAYGDRMVEVPVADGLILLSEPV